MLWEGAKSIQAIDFIGRSERIRTSDPCLPKTVLYQAELHSDRGGGSIPGDLDAQGGFCASRTEMAEDNLNTVVCSMSGQGFCLIKSDFGTAVIHHRPRR